LKNFVLGLVLFSLILLSTVTIVAPAKVQAQGEYAVWTDKQVYQIGEIATIYMKAPKLFPGMDPVHTYQLVVMKPDGSAVLIYDGFGSDSILTFSAEASYPLGTWHVMLYESWPEWDPIPAGRILRASTYFEVIGGPADLVVYKCWVSPANPKQEDAVTFYAVIANIGGSDANNFRLETYLDGSLYDSGSLSLRAGQQVQVWSEIVWRAEDGSHTVRWVINPDRSIEESNYGNNEASCSFFVSPRTVTATVTITKTSTRTQTQRTDVTSTTTRTIMITRTTDTTVLRTVTAGFTTVTQTLTGLITSTIYSPTVTVTVTSTAQMVSNPVLWLLLSAFAMIGAVIQLPRSERLGRLLPELARRIVKRHGRRALFAVSLVSLIVVSVLSQAGQQAYASTVTTTRTATVTEWTTLTQSLTSTRYITSTATDTSTFMRTSTQTITITPTVTRTVDMRSTVSIYLPTTTTVIVRQEDVEIELRILGSGPYMKQSYEIEVTLLNKGSSPVSGTLVVDENYLGSDPNRMVGGELGKWPLSAYIEPTTGYRQQASIAANGRAILDEIRFLNSWQWIKPVKSIDRFLDLFYSVMSIVVFGLLTPDKFLNFLRLMKEGTSFFKALQSAGIILETEWISVLDFGISLQFLTSTKTFTRSGQVAVLVPEIKLEALNDAFTFALAKMSLAIITAILAALVLGGVTLPLILKLVMAAATGAIMGASWALYDAAQDPPSDYLQETTLGEAPVPQSIQDHPDSPEKRFGLAALRLSSFLNASSNALNRYYAASEAEDLTYMRTSLESARNSMNRAREELAVMLDNLQQFKDKLPAMSPKIAKDAQKVLKDYGLPSDLVKLYNEMGIAAYLPTLARIFTESYPGLVDVPVADYLLAADAQMNRTVTAIDSTLSNVPQDRVWTGPLLSYLYVIVPVAFAIVAVLAYTQRRRLRTLLRRSTMGTRKDIDYQKGYPQTFCAHCGAEIPYGHETSYCIECGKPIRK